MTMLIGAYGTLIIPSERLKVTEQVPISEIDGVIVSTPEATVTGKVHVEVKLIITESLFISVVIGKV